MHVLLIDDHTHHADRLEQALLDREPHWQVSSTTYDRDARAALGEGAYRAIVASDSRGVDELVNVLMSVRDRVPHAVRVAIVDGLPAVRMVIGADVAHCVRIGPLDAEGVAASLARVHKLERLLDDEALRARIASLNHLPARPGLALDLMRENAAGSADLRAIAQRLHGEPVMAAKLLQLSNSAYYARGRPILDLERALTRLGMETTINLVLAVEAFSSCPQADNQNRAVLASQIATRVLRDMRKPALAPIGATAATLADIGRLLPLPSTALPSLRRDDDDDELRDVVSLPARAGAYLLSLWGLPWPIVEAVAFRERAALVDDDGFGLSAAVHTACALANGDPLDEALLESLDAMEFVPAWTDAAREGGAPEPVRSVSASARGNATVEYHLGDDGLC